jgi:hypothetical protein
VTSKSIKKSLTQFKNEKNVEKWSIKPQVYHPDEKSLKKQKKSNQQKTVNSPPELIFSNWSGALPGHSKTTDCNWKYAAQRCTFSRSGRPKKRKKKISKKVEAAKKLTKASRKPPKSYKMNLFFGPKWRRTEAKAAFSDSKYLNLEFSKIHGD